MKGRKPKPKTAAQRTTADPTPTAGRPACPKHVTGEAREEWDRICDELDAMGILATADRQVITLLVKAWQRWTEAEAKIAEMGLMVGAPKTKVPMHNPYLSISNNAHAQCLKLLTELGLTPSARSRIKLPPKENDADDFDFDLQ